MSSQVQPCQNSSCGQWFTLGSPQLTQNDVLFFVCNHYQSKNIAITVLGSSPNAPQYHVTGLLRSL